MSDWREEFDRMAYDNAQAMISQRQGEKKAQLGDAVESFLASHGVTPERYVAFKAKFGLPPTCGCADRKRWLNRLGEHFGINDKLSEFLKRRTRKES